MSTVIAFLWSLNAFPQANNTFLQMPKIVPSSPEASALYKVSDVPIDYSSGAANINIPLYNIKEGNISVPISISYNTSGIKVQDIAGMVGLGWNLSFGGVINVKDEVHQSGATVLNSAFKQTTDIINGNQLLANNFCTNVLDGAQAKQTPQYYYSFGGYSGSFYYDINNQLCINASDQRLLIIGVTNGFCITTPEGVQYTFTDQEMASNTYGANVSAFFISQILDLNTNRTIKFKYKTTPGYSQINESQSLDYVTSPSIGTTSVCPMAPSNTSSSFSVTSIGCVQIDSIIFSSGYIKFLASNDRLDINPTRIYQLGVFDNNNNSIKEVVLSQSYFISSGASNPIYNHRLKLDSVAFIGTDGSTAEKYNFAYNTQYSPSYQRSDGHNCTGVDYWGYYNGLESNGGLIPQDVIASSDFSNYQVPSTLLGNRKANQTYAQAFILNQIKYPTGGFVNFYYESNVDNGYVLGNVVGGLRIKQISYYDNVTNSYRSKYYNYNNGTIPFTYNTIYSFDKIKTNQCAQYTSSNFNTRNVYSDPLGTLAYVIHNSPFYSQVEEYEMDSVYLKQKTIYYYDTVPQFWIQAMWIPDYGNEYVTEKDWLKSQLLKKTEYYKIDQSNNYHIVKKIENSYTDNMEANPQIGVHVVPANQYDLINGELAELPSPPLTAAGLPETSVVYNLFDAKNSHGSRTLTTQRMVDYTDTDSLTTITNYDYTLDNSNFFNTNNYYYYLWEKQTTSSKGDTMRTEYTHPNDVYMPSAAIDSLITKNVLSPIIQEQDYKNVVLLYSTQINYALWPTGIGSIVLPQTIQYQQGTDPFETRLQYFNYDAYGNPLEVSKANDVHEIYLWGYNSEYPVAKVVGSNYATVSGFINQSILDNPANDQALRTELNKIRTGLSGTKALVTTYTYAPLIGMTSQTDPNNRTYSYEYDPFGRLKIIRDQDGNVLKKNNYNYAGPTTNNNISPPFTPAPCQPSFTWNSTNVPASNITSTAVQLSGTTVSFALVLAHYFFGSGTTTVDLGNLACSSCFPTATRTVPMIVSTGSQYLFNVIISATGDVQLQLVSAYPPPIGTSNISIQGSYDLLTTTYYSVAQTVTFTRNNCPSGQTGSGVAYLLPAYSFTSTVSQADADLQATNSLSSHGQIYANGNGTCSLQNTGSFTANSSAGWSIFNTPSVVINGSTVTCSITIRNTSFASWGAPFVVGTIAGGCEPFSPRTFSTVTGADTWSVTIAASGSVTVTLTSGPAPPSGIVSLGNITYNQ
jgi:YD repeat-containing protein